MKGIREVSVLLFIIAGLHAQVDVNLSYSPSDLNISKVVLFDTLEFDRISFKPADGVTEDTGKPEIPYDAINVLLPPGSKLLSVDVISSNYNQIQGEYTIVPVQKPISIGDTIQQVNFIMDTIFYKTNQEYPSNLVEVLGVKNFRGYSILKLKISPIKYIPGYKKVILYTGISIRVNYVENYYSHKFYERISKMGFETEKNFVKSLVVNPDDFERFYGSRRNLLFKDEENKKLNIMALPSLNGLPVDYVIITSREIEPYLKDFVRWKFQKGWVTTVRTTEWIDENYQGMDLQEKIRKFIQDACKYWGTTFVLLAGDADVVPVRELWAPLFGFTASDLYYSDVYHNKYGFDYDFNYDKDDTLGEYLDDRIDGIPDVNIGRISLSLHRMSPDDINAVLNKLMNYEKLPNPSTDYPKNVLLIGESIFWPQFQPIWKASVLCSLVVDGVPDNGDNVYIGPNRGNPDLSNYPGEVGIHAEEKSFQGILLTGRPSIDPNTDFGVFLWFETQNISVGDTMRLRIAVAGRGEAHNFKIIVRTVAGGNYNFHDGYIDHYNTDFDFYSHNPQKFPYRIVFETTTDANDPLDTIVVRTYHSGNYYTQTTVENIISDIDFYFPLNEYRLYMGAADYNVDGSVNFKADVSLNRVSFINTLNTGNFNLIVREGHADIKFIGTGTEYGRLIPKGSAFGINHIVNLSNPYPFIFVDYSSRPNFFDYNSIAEEMVTGTHYGAVAYLGHSRGAYTGSEVIMKYFLHDVYFNNAPHLGKSFSYTIANIPLNWFSKYGYNFQGEPEMLVWTNTLKNFTVTYPPSLNVGVSDINIKVESEGFPISDAICVLYKESSSGEVEVFKYGTTDNTGSVVFNDVSIPSTGNLILTVWKETYYHNYIPYQVIIPVLPASGYFVSFSKYKVDDRESSNTSGNGDNVPNPGEKIILKIAMNNTGNQTAYNVTGTLISSSPDVEILTPTVNFGDISPNSSSSGEFLVKISESIRKLIFEPKMYLEIKVSGIYEKTDTFPLKIFSDSLILLKDSVEIEPITPNFVDVKIYPTLKNIGEGAARGVKGILKLAEELPDVYLVDTLINFGDIPADVESFSGNDYFRVVMRNEYMSRGVFNLNIKDYYRRKTIIKNVDLIGPPSAFSYVKAEPLQGGIRVMWEYPDDQKPSDFLGFNVYRSEAGSRNFIKVNNEVITTDEFFDDFSVTEWKFYDYYVRAVDRNGNESPRSEIVTDRTNPPYEELLWPVTYQPGFRPKFKEYSPIKISDLDFDGKFEIITVVDSGILYVFNSDGSLRWSRDYPGSTFWPLQNWVGISDWDKDGIKEIFVSGRNLQIFDAFGNLEWELPSNNGILHYINAPVLADIDGDGYDELIVSSWNEITHELRINVWKYSDLNNPYWSKRMAGYVYAADITGDNVPEFMVLMGDSIKIYQDTFPLISIASPSGYSFAGSNLCAADLDNDGKAEIIVGITNTATLQTKTVVIDGDGTFLYEWTLDVGQAPIWANWQRISVGNLDSDPELEIVSTLTKRGLYVLELNNSGTYSAKYDFYNKEIQGEPLIANIENEVANPVPEIIVPVYYSKPYHWPYSKLIGEINVLRYNSVNGTFEEISGFPIIKDGSQFTSTPAVFDFDADNLFEIVSKSYFDNYIYSWKIPYFAPPYPQKVYWAQERYDEENTGWYRGPYSIFHYGKITENTTWENEIYLFGDVRVLPGVNLNILPGTKIYILPNADYYNLGNYPDRIEIINNGILNINGTKNRRVKFLPYSAPMHSKEWWFGIKIEGGGGEIEYTELKGAMRGVYVKNNQETQIKHSVLNKNIYAIHLENASNVTISSDTLIENELGIYIRNSNRISIDTNYLFRNGASLLSKTLGDNDSSQSLSGTGIRIINSRDITIKKNKVIDCIKGIFGTGYVNMRSSGNIWKGNSIHGIDLDLNYASRVLIYGDTFINNAQGGRNYPKRTWNEFAGVTLGHRYHYSGTTNITVENCYFKGNLTGLRVGKYGRNLTVGKLSVLITNNISDSNFYGMAFYAGNADSIYITVNYNTLQRNDSADVFIRSLYDSLYVNLGNLSDPEHYNPGSNHFLDTLYSIINLTPFKTYAQGNLWVYSDSAKIDSTIFDDEESGGEYGKVVFTNGQYVWGEIPRDTTLSGTISIGGDLVVPKNVTLKIQPPAVFRFAKNLDMSNSGNDPLKSELIIRGKLKILKPALKLQFQEKTYDTTSKFVTFTSDGFVKEKGDWFGIIFEKGYENEKTKIERLNHISDVLENHKGEENETELENIILEYATTGITYKIKKGELELENSEIRNIENEGIKMFTPQAGGEIKFGFENVKIKNTSIGIWSGKNTKGEIKKCIIDSNSTGLYFTGNSKAEIKESEFKYNDIASYIDQNSHPAFGKDEWGYNKFISNTSYHIYNNTPHTIHAKNCYWGTMNIDSIKAKIYDKEDNPGVGEVKIIPLWDGGNTVARSGIQSLNNSDRKPEFLIPTISDRILKIYIFKSSDKPFHLTAFDITGRKIWEKQVKTKGKDNFVIKEELPAKGIYFIMIEKPDKVIKRKIITVK